MKHLIVVNKKGGKKGAGKFRVFFRCIVLNSPAKVQYHIADFYSLRGALWYADRMSEHLGIETAIEVKCDGNLTAI